MSDVLALIAAMLVGLALKPVIGRKALYRGLHMRDDTPRCKVCGREINWRYIDTGVCWKHREEKT